MPRRKRSYTVCRRIWPIGLVLATGLYTRALSDDTLKQRVVPREVGPASSTGQDRRSASNRPLTDQTIRPASLRTQTARPLTERLPAPLPPAIVGPSPRAETNRLDSPSPSLPGDSDEATLDAIAATGKVVTLPDAVKLAFRYQPRLCPSSRRSIRRGAQQIVFSTFLPTVAANYDVGEYSLGVGGNPIRLGKGLPGSNFLPGLGALPIGLNTGTNFEVAEVKIQWLLLDFGGSAGPV